MAADTGSTLPQIRQLNGAVMMENIVIALMVQKIFSL